jgi:CRP-like cAMP-binding protein
LSLEEEIRHLRNVPMFANLDAAKLKLLAFTSERLTFKPGEILFDEGRRGDAAFVILDGTAAVTTHDEDRPLHVADLGRNEIVGEIAMLCDVPRTATVTASTRLTALKLSRDVFFRLIRDDPDMAIDIMRELARRLEATTQQLRESRMQG